MIPNYQNSYSNPYTDRLFLAQLEQRLAAQMATAGSSSMPYINSTLRPTTITGTPTMFGQVQGVLGAFSPELAALSGNLSNPLIQNFLPADATNFINTLLRSPPLGGTSDPSGFMMAQLASNVGRGIPMINLPFDFTNMQATDTYLAQRQAFNQYMGQLGTNPLGATSIQAFQFGQNAQNINKIIALRNALNMRNEDAGFKNAFALTSSVFGPRGGSSDALLAAASSINDEAAAAKFYNENKAAIDKTLDTARYTSGLIQGADFFSKFLGGNSVETAGMQSLGDFMFDVLNVGNNRQTFIPGVATALGSIGGLSTAMGTGVNAAGQSVNLPIANILAGRLSRGIDDAGGVFSGLRDLRFKRGGELISSLSQTGLIDFGGADIYGSLNSNDVDKMTQAVMNQLEGFSKIVEAGKRAQLGVQEVVQGLDAVYGGALTKEINLRAGTALFNMKTTGAASTAIASENARRAQAGVPPLTPGSPEAEQFLAAEAQRVAGADIADSLSNLVNVGKLAGIDARGSVAVAQTVNQMLENIGMVPGSGGTVIAERALAMVADSRARGIPITIAQGIAATATAVQSGQRDPNVLSYVALERAAEIDPSLLNDPAFQAAKRQFLEGKGLAQSTVDGILTNAGFNKDTIANIRDEAPLRVANYAESISRGFNKGALGPMAAITRALGAEGNAIVSAIDTYAIGQGSNKEALFSMIFKLGQAGKISEVMNLAKAAGLTDAQAKALADRASSATTIFGDVAGRPGGVALISALDELGEVPGAALQARAQTRLGNILTELAKSSSAPGEQIQAALDKARADKENTIFEQLRKDPANAGKSDEELREQAKTSSELNFNEFLKAVGGISPARALEYIAGARQKIGKAVTLEDFKAVEMLSALEVQYSQQAITDKATTENEARAAITASKSAEVGGDEVGGEAVSRRNEAKKLSAVPMEQSLNELNSKLGEVLAFMREGKVQVILG